MRTQVYFDMPLPSILYMIKFTGYRQYMIVTVIIAMIACVQGTQCYNILTILMQDKKYRYYPHVICKATVTV